MQSLNFLNNDIYEIEISQFKDVIENIKNYNKLKI